MTETDCTKRPLPMPVKFIPYLQKYRLYKLLKDMLRDLIVNLPSDHLKHMKIYLNHHLHSSKDVDRIILLLEPELNIDIKAVAKQMIKELGCFVITRRCVMDRYEKHDDYKPGCICPVLMSEVTKALTMKDPVPQAGWLMFDHPCTVREARVLQQDGILPTVTLVLMSTPAPALPTHDDHTRPRNFFQQDFEGLKFAYKATLKEVHIDSDDDTDKVTSKCCTAIQACAAGAQGSKQGFQVVGAPGVYRVVLIGPRGSGRKSQARLLSKHFGLVCLIFEEIYNEARQKANELGERIRKFGTNVQLRGEVVKERLLRKDCIDHGWVLIGYPLCACDFEVLDSQATPPNRPKHVCVGDPAQPHILVHCLEAEACLCGIIFLNVDIETCKQRIMQRGIDWCTGEIAPLGGPRVMRHPNDNEEVLDKELDTYFLDIVAEMRAAAGLTATEIEASEPFEKVQVKLQAAVIAAPPFDIEVCSQIRNVRGD